LSEIDLFSVLLARRAVLNETTTLTFKMIQFDKVVENKQTFSKSIYSLLHSTTQHQKIEFNTQK